MHENRLSAEESSRPKNAARRVKREQLILLMFGMPLVVAVDRDPTC